jgi:hypothetical protein
MRLINKIRNDAYTVIYTETDNGKYEIIAYKHKPRKKVIDHRLYANDIHADSGYKDIVDRYIHRHNTY